jgi:hypothetical protein
MASPDYKSAAKEDSCLSEKLPPFHVVFPWKMRPPNSPERPPLRGSARNAIDSLECIPGLIFPHHAKVELVEKIKVLAINPGQSVQRVEGDEPKTLSPAELHRLYAGTSVPRHRFLAPALTEAVNSPEIAPHPAKWLDGISGIDLSKVVDAWLNTNRNTEFEQLYCIGLEPETGQLTGVFQVKQGSGYSGGPATAGSREYVAFWVDWGLGFQYEGTVSAPVHDFRRLPPAGLEYSISLPCDLLSRAQRSGEAAKTVKVRAVLSWNTPPSTTDPNAPVVWGNILESRIPIPASHADRAGDQVRRLASSSAGDAEEIVHTGVNGLIVDAAIKAMTGSAFGQNSGLTVVLGSTVARPGATDRATAIDTSKVDDRSSSFALYLWDRTNKNPGAASKLNHASTELLLSSEELSESTGFPQKQTEPAVRVGLRLRLLEKREASK